MIFLRKNIMVRKIHTYYNLIVNEISEEFYSLKMIVKRMYRDLSDNVSIQWLSIDRIIFDVFKKFIIHKFTKILLDRNFDLKLNEENFHLINWYYHEKINYDLRRRRTKTNMCYSHLWYIKTWSTTSTPTSKQSALTALKTIRLDVTLVILCAFDLC
jgi:hypothetical protein